MQQLLFLKQLVDNAEYANENGMLKVIGLFKNADSDVTEGTSYALGAFQALQRLIELRPDLRTPRVVDELRVLTKGDDERVRSAATAALDKMGIQ